MYGSFSFLTGISAVLVAVQLAVAQGPSWTAVDQPDLGEQLAKAPMLKLDNLGPASKSVQPWGTRLIPNPDGQTYDVQQWFIRDYQNKTRVYIADLATGAVKLQTFPKDEGRARVESADGDLAWDGKYYGVTPDAGTTGGIKLYVYDPARNEVEDRGVIVPELSGERTPFVLSPNGKFYGTGSYYKRGQVGLFSYDPKTAAVRDYGPIGPKKNGTAFGYWLGVDDTHVYIADGKIPWALLAVNIDSGEVSTLATATPGDYGVRMRIWPRFPGAVARVQNDDDAMPKDYWLWHGKLLPMPDDAQPKDKAQLCAPSDKVAPPWPRMDMPWSKAPPQPQIYNGQVDPDDQGRGYLWWRTAEDARKWPRTLADADPSTVGWKSVVLDDIERYPLRIHHMVALPNGKIFGTPQGYLGRFLFDPATGQSVVIGRGGASPYAFLAVGDKLYWTGYSSGPIFCLDYTKPWTLDRGGPPGHPAPQQTSPDCNPRFVGDTFTYTRVKKMFAMAQGADGLIYMGGIGQRDYNGGGLGWYDPKTGATGGMWKPFSGYGIHWLMPALQGSVLVISTRTAEDELENNKRPESAKLFVFDVEAKKTVREIVPVTGAQKAGPVIEVSPGRLIGITEDPTIKGGGILYGVDINSGQILFTKKLPRTLAFMWAQGTDQYDFQKGPDGLIYTYLGDVLVRIDPADARVEVLGKVDRVGALTFVGKDAYLSGTDDIRRATALAK